MKHFIATTVFIFCTSVFLSQTPFEGKITYMSNVFGEVKKDSTEVFFGIQKIKSRQVGPGSGSNAEEDILVDFAKGKLYHINNMFKTYRIEILGKNPTFSNSFAKTEKRELRLNESCTAFSLKGISLDKIDQNGRVYYYWFADSLFFPVKEEYALAQQTIMFTNGKTTGMGMKVGIKNDKENNVIEQNPVLIEKKHVQDSIFTIPKNYKLVTKDYREISLSADNPFKSLPSTLKVNAVKKKTQRKGSVKPKQ